MVNTQATPGVFVRKVVDATKELSLTVTPKHHKNATRCDGKRCVVAQAFDDSNIGEAYESVEVGLSVTKITFPHKIIRYATPAALVPHIRHFDRTGTWNLPAGTYVFKPLCPTMRLGARPDRWMKHRTNTDGSGRDMMKGERATPTRHISRCEV